MRIISKFHDYYDIGLSYGIDKSLVYVRHEQELEKTSVPEVEKILNKEHERWWSHHVEHYVIGSDGNKSVGFVFVGFCGKLYSGLSIDWYGKTDVVYSKHDLDSFLKKYQARREEQNY